MVQADELGVGDAGGHAALGERCRLPTNLPVVLSHVAVGEEKKEYQLSLQKRSIMMASSTT
jgi:hypothetical protein